MSNNATIPSWLNFLFGGVNGCIATAVLHPIDTIKTNIQIASEKGRKTNFIEMGKHFISHNSFLCLYKGLDSALLRAIVYTTMRFGIFYSIMDKIEKKTGKAATLLQKSFSGFIAGGIGAFFGNPADVLLVRMQVDNTLPIEKRRKYKHVIDGIKRVINEEGIKALWFGSLPNIIRASVLNMFMLAPFEEFKELLINLVPNVKTRSIISSIIASFLGAFTALPFDNAKTKIQNMHRQFDGTYPYSGTFDCLFKTIKLEGFSRLWVGFPTFYARTGPHIVFTLLLNDICRNVYIKSIS